MDIPVIQQAKIQAQVLVPLVKALQAELGEARANALVRNALGDLYRQFGAQFRQAKQEPDVGKFVGSAFRTYARDGALDYDVVEQSEDSFAIDVKGCRYAEFYKELGLTDLGYRMHCNRDFAMVAGFNDELELSRSQTIMEGGACCD